MKNQEFALLPHTAKQCKLRTILRSRTNNSLTEEHIRHIMQSIVPSIQYEIRVFTKPTAFYDALRWNMYDRGEIVFGQAPISNGATSCPIRLQSQVPVAAIMTRFKGAQTKSSAHAILIYVPSELYTREGNPHEEQSL